MSRGYDHEEWLLQQQACDDACPCWDWEDLALDNWHRQIDAWEYLKRNNRDALQDALAYVEDRATARRSP